MERERSLFFSITDRPYGVRRRRNIRQNMLGSTYLIKRLKCEHVFVGHNGCVNTVAWNEPGDLLLSGADDCRLNIYQLSSMKPVHSIASGHHANIFSAKFLPCTGDTKIASCSGDGILHYNDVNSPSFYGKNPFHCHSGTTYEVNTTPGDPHTFLSSGEDGTVRLFDLRNKTKCLCESCGEDVLIDCGKAVTSFSVNPVCPYYIAVGCENSVLRVYDHRCLTTDRQRTANNKEQGLLYQFRPRELEQRDCRVTSLKYSSDGRSLLASFCSDYVYLFDAKPESSGQALSGGTKGKKPDGSFSRAGNDPPMKRLRLRGDWSDTGPNARPESEDSGNSENTFVQRMSGYLTRWIEESIRNARRRQRRRDRINTRQHAEESPESPDEDSNINRDENRQTLTREDDDVLLHGNDDCSCQETGARTENDITQDGGSDLENLEKDQSEMPRRSDPVREDHMEETCSSRASDESVRKSVTHVHSSNDPASGQYSTDTTSADVASKSTCPVSSTDNFECSENNSEFLTNDPENLTNDSECLTTSSEPVRNNEKPHANDFDSCTKDFKNSTNTSESLAKNSECSTNNSGSVNFASNRRRLKKQSQYKTKCASCCNTDDNVRRKATGSEVKSQDIGCHGDGAVDRGTAGEVGANSNEELVAKENDQTLRELNSKTDLAVCSNVGENEPRTLPNNPGKGTTESDFRTRVSIRDARPVETGTDKSDGDSCSSGSREPSVVDSSESDDNDDDDDDQGARRNAAASTIQNFLRRRHKKGSAPSKQCDASILSEARQVYKGHRNARTMIKEANFWGDDFVLSGSDCGRIFIWSRHTAELVMLMEGDRRVVNCVQPHPYDPILATSGIDYDVKLWTPTALNVSRLDNANEVIARNEKMLRESRDTLTVPASFMIRVLSSLHRVRFHAMSNEHPPADSDSDWDEE